MPVSRILERTRTTSSWWATSFTRLGRLTTKTETNNEYPRMVVIIMLGDSNNKEEEIEEEVLFFDPGVGGVNKRSHGLDSSLTTKIRRSPESLWGRERGVLRRRERLPETTGREEGGASWMGEIRDCV